MGVFEFYPQEYRFFYFCDIQDYKTYIDEFIEEFPQYEKYKEAIVYKVTNAKTYKDAENYFKRILNLYLVKKYSKDYIIKQIWLNDTDYTVILNDRYNYIVTEQINDEYNIILLTNDKAKAIREAKNIFWKYYNEDYMSKEEYDSHKKEEEQWFVSNHNATIEINVKKMEVK